MEASVSKQIKIIVSRYRNEKLGKTENCNNLLFYSNHTVVKFDCNNSQNLLHYTLDISLDVFSVY